MRILLQKTQCKPVFTDCTASKRLAVSTLLFFRSGIESHSCICTLGRTAENPPELYAAGSASLFCRRILGSKASQFWCLRCPPSEITSVYLEISARNSASRSKVPAAKPGISLMDLQMLMLKPVRICPISRSEYTHGRGICQ